MLRRRNSIHDHTVTVTMTRYSIHGHTVTVTMTRNSIHGHTVTVTVMATATASSRFPSHVRLNTTHDQVPSGYVAKINIVTVTVTVTRALAHVSSLSKKSSKYSRYQFIFLHDAVLK